MTSKHIQVLLLFLSLNLIGYEDVNAWSNDTFVGISPTSTIDTILQEKGFFDKKSPGASVPENSSASLSKTENNNYQFKSFDELVEKSKENNQFLELSEDGDDVQADVNQTLTEYQGNPKVQKASEAFGFLSESKLLDKLTGEELVELPVGISKTIGGNKYTMCIARAKLLPQYTELEVYFEILFSDERRIFFGADNIKYSSEGGFIGDVRLGLYADFALCRESADMAIFMNKFQEVPGGDPIGCYVTVDCEGFVEMRIDASFHLSRKWVLPADLQGNVLPDNSRVKADFALTVSDWDDILIEANLPSFVLTKVPEIAFMLSGVVIDLSDKRNANGFVAPPAFNYIDPQDGSVQISTAMAIETGAMPGEGQPDGSSGNSPPEDNSDPSLPDNSSSSPGGADPSWRGVFIQAAQIVFPSEFNGGGNQNRLTAGVQNLYVDSRGVTGAFFLDNVLPMGSLKADKWDMSLDEINVDIVYNEVVKFSFKGGIILPVIDEETPILYSASANLKRKHYQFSVLLNQQTSFPVDRVARGDL